MKNQKFNSINNEIMQKIENKQELKWAQEGVYEACRIMNSVNLRLEGKKYYNDAKKVEELLLLLNTQLIQELRKD